MAPHRLLPRRVRRAAALARRRRLRRPRGARASSCPARPVSQVGIAIGMLRAGLLGGAGGLARLHAAVGASLLIAVRLRRRRRRRGRRGLAARPRAGRRRRRRAGRLGDGADARARPRARRDRRRGRGSSCWRSGRPRRRRSLVDRAAGASLGWRLLPAPSARGRRGRRSTFGVPRRAAVAAVVRSFVGAAGRRCRWRAGRRRATRSRWLRQLLPVGRARVRRRPRRAAAAAGARRSRPAG